MSELSLSSPWKAWQQLFFDPYAAVAAAVFVAVIFVRVVWVLRLCWIKSSEMQALFDKQVFLVRISQGPGVPMVVLHAQAAAGMEDHLARRHIGPARSAVELVPTTSLALTVLSLVFVVLSNTLGDANFNQAFATKLWITFWGMVIFVFLEILISIRRSRLVEALDRLRHVADEGPQASREADALRKRLDAGPLNASPQRDGDAQRG